MSSALPAEAIERAQQIADSAPPVSAAKLARLTALIQGAQPDAPAAAAA